MMCYHPTNVYLIMIHIWGKLGFPFIFFLTTKQCMVKSPVQFFFPQYGNRGNIPELRRNLKNIEIYGKRDFDTKNFEIGNILFLKG